MRAKKPSPLPVTYIDLSTRFHEESCPEVTVGNGGFPEAGYSVWEEAQAIIDEWRGRIPADELIELTAIIEWADGETFECEMHMPHASQPCLSEECNLAVHLSRYLHYDAGLRDYWAPTRASARQYFASGFLRPGLSAEEMERGFDLRNDERTAEAIEMLRTREVPQVPAEHRDPYADMAVLLYRIAGREVQPHEMDTYSFEAALHQVGELPDASLRHLSTAESTALLATLLQHEDQRVRLAGVQLSARLAPPGQSWSEPAPVTAKNVRSG